MIVFITGKLTKKTPDHIIIDLNGLGYFCYISANTYDDLPSEGEVASLLTFFNVTEHKHELYAFSEDDLSTTLSSNPCPITIGVSIWVL